MEESKSSTVKQAQAGDDSGYSCTSTQSKYSVKSCHSQSASSGDSCFEERMSTTLETTQNGKTISTLHSKSSEKKNEILLRNVSSLETSNNQESNNNNSKSEQINLTTFEPQLDQLFNDNDKLKKPSSAFKMDLDEASNLNNTNRENHDQNNASFLQLTTLYEPYCDYIHINDLSSNPCDKSTISNMASKIELNEKQMQLEEIIESDEVPEESFGAIVSMNDGLIINTSSSIHKSMGYPKDMWKRRPFTDFIHPKDSIAFTNYVTSILKDPCVISRQDDSSNVTFLKSKNNDGFYCNMRKYKCLNTGYSISPKKYLYQVCKLTITFKDLSDSSVSPTLIKTIQVSQPQLILIIKAQLIHSAYTYPEEKKENPLIFITKYNTLFEWCYVDQLIISYLGYLPQNIIGTSIFNYYNKDDLTTIKEIHENMIKSKSVPFKGKPYWFKCQNGDFALVQTEWSNFVNPWSGIVEFVIGKHQVIQGPINPDVTIPVDNVTSEANVLENKKKLELNEDINKTLNKNINKVIEIPHQKNQTTDLKTNVKQQISQKFKDMALFMNSLVDGIDPSACISLKVEVQPETCGSFSDHNSVMLGEISPHHNYERKSSSGTSPSYTQLNYNDNIQRFFKSNLKSSSSEDMKTEIYSTEITTEDEVTPIDIDTDNVKKELCPLHQNVTPYSSINENQMSTGYYSEQNLNHNHQQPLTQKMLLRHTKKMEDDLVKQHKNNANKIKSCKKHLPDGTIDNPDTPHGLKRCNSSLYENKPHKLTKRKHAVNNNNVTDVITETQKSEDNTASIPVITKTKIWPPCQITRDSQTTFDLPRPPTLPNQVLSYNIPYGDNVMPVKHNEYENTCGLMDPYHQNQEPLSSQLQPMPLYATIPVINHIPQNSHIVQPYLHYHNQV
ncbi:Hypothetical protein CINCED_3A013027 [Cinara cedri]|uniref:Period circadian protein n=1 Tax=Cinara cedri TaxID=506608 RepID=A0A5E4N724_9HEMI|nr:Hypothetical protein CINCED_3A013027 [Cinara cedri]